ncbi:MAG: hypothetical protein ACQEVA_15525 [Myxococcota bacterium]
MRRRRQRRRRGRGGGRLDGTWRLLTSPLLVGLLLVGAGAVLVGGALGTAGDIPSATWWVTALEAPRMFGTAASLMAAAVVLLLGGLIRRHELIRRRPEDLPEPDAVFERERAEPVAGWKRLISTLGAAALIVGGAIMVGYWFESQTHTPASEVSLIPGQTTEYYGVPLGNRSIKVMLPRRLELTALEGGVQPQARVRFFEVGDDADEATTMLPGDSLDAAGYRISFAGVETDPARPRAVLASRKDNTIPVAAGVGESFQVEVGGPEYRVEEVVRNYQGVLGPAARVSADERGEFWVFQRRPEADRRPVLLHDLYVERVEASPAAVFKISPVQPFWPVSAAGTLFVFGFALLILFPERIVRRRSDEGGDVYHAWSLTEAGRLRAQKEDS